MSCTQPHSLLGTFHFQHCRSFEASNQRATKKGQQRPAPCFHAAWFLEKPLHRLRGTRPRRTSCFFREHKRHHHQPQPQHNSTSSSYVCAQEAHLENLSRILEGRGLSLTVSLQWSASGRSFQPGQVCDVGVPTVSKMRLSWSDSFLPGNTEDLVNSSATMQPTDHRSTAEPYCRGQRIRRSGHVRRERTPPRRAAHGWGRREPEREG